MSLRSKGEAKRLNMESQSPVEEVAGMEQRQAPVNVRERSPIATTVKVNLVRRRLLLGSAVVTWSATEMFDGDR
jgi:hypothetical protein